MAPTFAAKITALISDADDLRKRRAVARWLLLGVAMIFIQTLLGGVTRLTGSGLSITEWKPIMGAVPPLHEAQWQEAFAKYKQIAQYRYLNADFTLSDFKHIYFWEWLHREWARVGLTLVFAAGFIYFLVKKYFDRRMIMPFIILFLLGALQGLIGWKMVQSGLNDTDLYVSHDKLAIHFMAAMLLACYTLWFALLLLIPNERRAADKKLHRFTVFSIALLSVQLVYGAFMAGLKAAPSAPTWPTINGSWLPGDLHQFGNISYTGITQILSNPIGVQFMHRTLAYTLLGVLTAWYLFAAAAARKQQNTLLAKTSRWPMIVVLLQVLLGIVTVLNGAHAGVALRFGRFETLAELHQLTAMLLLASLVVNLYVVRGKAVG